MVTGVPHGIIPTAFYNWIFAYNTKTTYLPRFHEKLKFSKSFQNKLQTT